MENTRIARNSRSRWVRWVGAAVCVAAACSPPGRNAGQRFFSALRLAKPQPVSASPAATPGTNANRQLQDAIGAMVSPAVKVTMDEPDRPAASVSDAAGLAGFAVAVPRARTDAGTFSVIGERAIEAAVDRHELQTILMEAGHASTPVPASLQGATLSIRAPRAARVQFGNCPAPVANTIQAQINGPPPASADNGSCLVLVQSPRATAVVPPGVDMAQLVEIALELAGMSPNQTRATQALLDWPSAAVLSLPRGVRSYDMVKVHGQPAMLISTGGRRGPTWALVWSKGGMVYQLAGYGNSADAVALAESVN